MDIDGIREFVIGMVLVVLIASAGAIALTAFQSNTRNDYVSSISNETITLSAVATPSTGAIAEGKGHLFISHTGIRNLSSENLFSFCNVSSTGNLKCNATGSTTCYIDYTHYTPNSMYNISSAGLSGVDNTTSFFGTAGTIAGVALLLTIVILAFYFVSGRAKE